MLDEREQIVWIVDLGGKIMQLASKKILDALQKIIANAQKYFPDILHR
jgi:carbon monoxide dehydrogenase subunit G